jgi:hypothetical protein
MDRDYAAVRRHVVQRLRKRALFWLHLIAYLIIIIHSSNVMRRFDNALILWVGVLFVHYLYTFEVWQRIVDRMVQRELGKSGAAEIKRKNEQVVLGEDGELVPLDEMIDIEDEAARPKRRERH